MNEMVFEKNVLNQKSPRLRLTARGRIVIVVFVSILLSAVLALAAMLGASSAQASTGLETGEAVVFEKIVAGPGDTLWGFAGELAPKADPRDVIAEIVALNQLDSVDLFVGQELAVPLKYSAS